MINRYTIGFKIRPTYDDIAMKTINRYGCQIVNRLSNINAIVAIIPDIALDEIYRDMNVVYIKEIVTDIKKTTTDMINE